MKKLFFFCAATLCLASCSTLSKTATTYDVNTSISSTNNAELVVSTQKVSLEYRPKVAIRRGGSANCKRAAVRELLKQNGDADVLVSPEYEVKSIHGIFRHGIRRVKVSGYPATYKKF